MRACCWRIVLCAQAALVAASCSGRGGFSETLCHGSSYPDAPECADGPLTRLLEAELGVVGAPMRVVQDASASAGAYVLDDGLEGTESGGTLLLTFTLEARAELYLWWRVRVPSTASDSFYLSVDGAAEQSPPTTQCVFSNEWQWAYVPEVSPTLCPAYPPPAVYTFEAGEHRLSFRSREAQSTLDAVLLTEDPDFVPAD